MPLLIISKLIAIYVEGEISQYLFVWTCYTFVKFKGNSWHQVLISYIKIWKYISMEWHEIDELKFCTIFTSMHEVQQQEKGGNGTMPLI